jgi:sec-independent protein translocase protein TatA
MLGNIGPLEIAIVLIIALIVFGPKRLPELGSGLGRGMREFKETITGEKKGDDEEPDDEVKALSASSSTASPSGEQPAEPEASSDKQG